MQRKEIFILSLWFKEGETTVLRGLLQHVKSGEKQSFANTEQLLALLRARQQQTEAISKDDEVIEGRED